MRLPGKGSVFVLLAFTLVLTLVGGAAAKRIVGTVGTNVVNGTAVRDDIFARGGNDVVWGRGGNDFLYGQRGADILQGDVGNDRLWGDAREDTLDGGPGGDLLYGGWGPDVIDAGAGNDVVDVREDDGQVDSVDCGPGRDTVFVNRKDRTFGCEVVKPPRRWGRMMPPGTVVTLGAGADTWSGAFANNDRHLVAGRAGDDVLDATAGSDVIWGNEDNDTLIGGNGRDWLLVAPARMCCSVRRATTGFGEAGDPINCLAGSTTTSSLRSTWIRTLTRSPVGRGTTVW